MQFLRKDATYKIFPMNVFVNHNLFFFCVILIIPWPTHNNQIIIHVSQIPDFIQS